MLMLTLALRLTNRRWIEPAGKRRFARRKLHFWIIKIFLKCNREPFRVHLWEVVTLINKTAVAILIAKYFPQQSYTPTQCNRMWAASDRGSLYPTEDCALTSENKTNKYKQEMKNKFVFVPCDEVSNGNYPMWPKDLLQIGPWQNAVWRTDL